MSEAFQKWQIPAGAGADSEATQIMTLIPPHSTSSDYEWQKHIENKV